MVNEVGEDCGDNGRLARSRLSRFHKMFSQRPGSYPSSCSLDSLSPMSLQQWGAPQRNNQDKSSGQLTFFWRLIFWQRTRHADKPHYWRVRTYYSVGREFSLLDSRFRENDVPVSLRQHFLEGRIHHRNLPVFTNSYLRYDFLLEQASYQSETIEFLG